MSNLNQVASGKWFSWKNEYHKPDYRTHIILKAHDAAKQVAKFHGLVEKGRKHPFHCIC